jgi:hypothetical protein
MASRQIEGYPTFLNDSAPRAQQALIEVNAVRAISTVGELAPHGSNVRSGSKPHIGRRASDVRSAGMNGPSSDALQGPLMTDTVEKVFFG